MSGKYQYEQQRAAYLKRLAAQKKRSEQPQQEIPAAPDEGISDFWQNSSLRDKERSRATAAKILGLAEDYRRGPYAVDGSESLYLSGLAWVGKELERCADALESIALSLDQNDQSARKEPLGSNFSAAPGTSAPETLSEGSLH